MMIVEINLFNIEIGRRPRIKITITTIIEDTIFEIGTLTTFVETFR